ncbi:MAG: DUF6603 domain-containing protein [Gloeotrichia echinulata HAB0833]
MNLQAELQEIAKQKDILVLAEKSWIPDKLKTFFNSLPQLNKNQLTNESVTLTVDNTNLIISSLKDHWGIPGIDNTAVNLEEMVFSFTEQNNKIDVQLQTKGSITISKSSLKVVGDLNNDGQFNFTLDSSPTSGFSLEEIFNFIEYKESIVLEDIIFQNLQLSILKFNLGFNNDDVITHIDIRCKSEKKWTIINNFADVENIAITLNYFYEASTESKSYYGNIQGQVKLDREYIEVRLPLFFGDNWLIEFIPPEGKQLPGLTTFTGYLPEGEKLQQTVNQGFQQLNFQEIAGLDNVYISFDMKNKLLENVNFQAHIFFEEDLKFQTDVLLPKLALYGILSPDTPINLRQLFTKYFSADTVTFPEIDITELNLSAEPSLGKYALSTAIFINEPKLISTDILDLELKHIEFQISKIYAGVYGLFNCIFKLYEVEFTAIVSRLESNNGWFFNAYLSDTQPLDLVELLNKFKVDIPTSLTGLKIEQLGLSFSTANKNLHFRGFGSLSLLESSEKGATGDKTASLQLDIDLKKDKSGWSGTFAGKLFIMGRNFDLVFDANSSNKNFIAAYYNPNGDTLKIQELVEYVSPSLAQNVPASLEFTLKDAILAYTNESTKKDSEENQSNGESKDKQSDYLFGIDIEGGLNLSDIKLPDLPLIGGSFSPDQTLKLSLQLLVAGDDFTVEEITNLNSLNSQGPSLPQQKIEKGVNIAALLRLGQETKPLSLPIGLNEGGLTDDPANASTSGNAITDTTAANVIAPAPAPDGTQWDPDGTQWIKIQKNFGPVHIERVGVKYQDKKIFALLDASLSVGGLTLGLDGLSVDSRLSPLQPEFSFRGLSIDYKNAAIEIGGAFLKQKFTPQPPDPAYTGFAGLAVIRAEVISLSAIGSYAKYEGQPSLFIYANLNIPIPIPETPFIITGLAGGFGFNRRLIPPDITQVTTFPLVQEVISGDSPTDNLDSLDTELQKLNQYIPPSVGEVFIAAGIKFSTFKLIESFALIILQIGQRLEIDILGLSTILVPPSLDGEDVEPTPPLAEAQLALKATFVLNEGLLSFEAQLTANSYILSKACHLTGGFAFFCWLKNNESSGAKAGDFVVSLGGYHPQYIVPKYYPVVPRLGISWQVNAPNETTYELYIKGQGYFTLTAKALMAGGCLEANWSSGPFKAWFKVAADFIISWLPYYYDATFYADIGASYTFNFIFTHTITVELGANIHLWGPDFSGTATVHLSIISFTVKFGNANSQKVKPIDWKSFKSSFLPKDDQICSITIQKGLVRQSKQTVNEKNIEHWIVNPKELVFATSSAIPIKEAYKKADTDKSNRLDINNVNVNRDFYIAPMGIEHSDNLTSKHIIQIVHGEGDKSNDFQFTPILKAVPAGLWGEPELTVIGDKKYLNPPKLNGEQFVENTLAGFTITAAEPPDSGHSAVIDCQKLQYDTELISDAYSWENLTQDDVTSADVYGEDAWKNAKDVISNSHRTNLLKVLGFANYEIDFGQSIEQDLFVKLK